VENTCECHAGLLANSASDCRKRLPDSYNKQVKALNHLPAFQSKNSLLN
jgi:hypothetical protein